MFYKSVEKPEDLKKRYKIIKSRLLTRPTNRSRPKSSSDRERPTERWSSSVGNEYRIVPEKYNYQLIILLIYSSVFEKEMALI
jgi:hypothetical protein